MGTTYLDTCMKVCPICKKEFCVTYVPNYTYKIISHNSLKLFCSWSCYNKGKDKQNKTRKYKSAYTI